MNQETCLILERHEPCRDNLIPILQEIQKEMGFISEAAVGLIANHLNMSQSDVFGVATFYSQFRFTRPGDHNVRICQGTACHVRGAKRIMDNATTYLGIKPGETTADYAFSLESVACFGSCALAPVVVVDDTVCGRMTAPGIRELLKDPK
jgi:NADH-quinone oxidoreductase subunit E